MGLFSPSTQTTGTQNTTSNQTSSYQPDPGAMYNWGQLLGGAWGLAGGLLNNNPPNATVADPTNLTSQYWTQAQRNTGAPDLSGLMNMYQSLYGGLGAMISDPSNVPNLPGQFGPGTIDFQNPFAGGVPTAAASTVSAPGGVSGRASDYLVNPQQVSPTSVSAERISAPGAINPITGLMQVVAPQLRNFQMDPAQQVGGPSLRDFQMTAAGPVAPSGLATTQSWLDPGTAAAFMSPYAQQVVDVQKQKAVEDWQAALEGQRSQAAAAGAYGGSRQAVEESTGQRDLQLQLAQIQATGLQNAYTQAQQQFNQQQQLGLGAQQFNIGTGLQAALANQQAQQMANAQNLAALLQTQGLGGQLGMQGQLANQQQGLQAALANQQAQEFGAGQQLQASLANQQTGLQAGLANAQFGMQSQLANQQAGLQAGLAAQQMGLQGALANAGYGMQAGLANQATGLQANLANQAAMMQALGLQYQGGLQGALQTQNLGMQGQQMGLQSAIQQQLLRNAQQQLNQGYTGQIGGLLGNMGNLGLAGYGAGLQGLGALQQAAAGQQGYQQQWNDVNYQNALATMTTPLQALSWLAQLQAMQPLPYTQTSSGTQNVTGTAPGPSLWQSILGGGLTAAGLLGGFKHGGRIPKAAGKPHGLALVQPAGKPRRAPARGLGVFAARAASDARPHPAVERSQNLPRP